VEHHGSESYFVVGEGLLAESIGGREETVEFAARTATPPFHFSRMGPRGKGKQLAEGARKRLGAAMTRSHVGGLAQIPAGFTYLGQFVDHDLTFDKSKVALGTNLPPAAMRQARSPSLDLDSLYGNGPQDPVSAKFYSGAAKLKLGRTVRVGSGRLKAHPGFDLPRGEGNTQAKKRRAVIPDHRNDENLAVAQTHLAFIRFHNRVVDSLGSSVAPAQRFEKARELAVKHYQWMLRTDYLPRICVKAVVDDVFKNGRKAFEVGANPATVPTMPIEFSVAAFRFGHSMIRSDYNWNAEFPTEQGSLFLLFEFSATGGRLGGFERLPSNWIADWRRMYNFRTAGRDDLKSVGPLNRAMRIDTGLVPDLRRLPHGAFGGKPTDAETVLANLAFRNLTRAKMVNLATGQQMVSFLKSKGVNATALTKAQIRDGKNGVGLDNLTGPQRDAVLRDTPLWFYVLREAEHNNGRLAGVGARIVAETFHRAMEGSTHSIVRDGAWKPTLGPDASTFRMVDLLLFAFEGKKRLLAPLGD
jgi:hypothetical protein